jgi:hypothetical protein
LYFFLDSTGREADDLRNSKSRLSSSFVFLNLKSIFLFSYEVLYFGQVKAHGLFTLEPSQLDAIFVPSRDYYREDCFWVSVNLLIVVVVTSGKG